MDRFQQSGNCISVRMLATLAATLIFSWSCAQGDQKGGGKKKNGDDAAGELGGKGSKPKDKTSEKTEGEGEGEEEGEESEEESGVSSEEQAKALLADCGASDIDNTDTDKVIYEKDLKSFPVSKQVLTVTVKVESTLKVVVTGKETRQGALVEVKEVTGLFSGLAKTEAERQAAESSGASVLTNVPFSEYSKLSEFEGWSGVVCTFVPVTKIVNERGGKKTVATFDPPLPSSVSPKATAARYKAEIGKKRTFDDIKATITDSDNPALDGKKSVTGSITVEEVDPEAEVDDGAGGKKKIKADAAYRVTYDFDTPQITFALGMAPVVTYYISHEKRDLVANTIDTSEAGGAVATFMHD
jgi:hypothetical protein